MILCTLKVENYWFKYLLCSLCLIHSNSLAQDYGNLRFSICPWLNLMLLKWKAIEFWLFWNPIMVMWQKILQMLLRLFTEIWESYPEQNIQKGSFLRSRRFAFVLLLASVKMILAKSSWSLDIGNCLHTLHSGYHNLPTLESSAMSPYKCIPHSNSHEKPCFGPK